MDLTTSYERTIDVGVRARYSMVETRMAAAVLDAASPGLFAEVIDVLSKFELSRSDLVEPGGNKSAVAKRLDEAFRALGWREGRIDTEIASKLRLEPWKAGGEESRQVRTSTVYNEGYKVDNMKGRVALDVEWNAKDGNLDRDVSAYRALYDMGFIDGAVLITRTNDDIRELATSLAGTPRFNTTTTTTLEKLKPRMTRGDLGGCPLLAIGITARCYAKDAEPTSRGLVPEQVSGIFDGIDVTLDADGAD